MIPPREPLVRRCLLQLISNLLSMPETLCRTFRYPLRPTLRQTQALLFQLEHQRELYNAAMQERISVWERERRSVSYFEQCRALKEIRGVRPEIFTSGVRLCRGTLKRLDRAFVAFYRRDQQGETPGYPRFKSVRRFNSLQWEDSRSWKIKFDDRRLYLPGIGDVKARYYRPILGNPKAITVKREGSKWWVWNRIVSWSERFLIGPTWEARRQLARRSDESSSSAQRRERYRPAPPCSNEVC